MPLSPGLKLLHYEILSSLGSGGMGEVFRARDSRLGREVAVKVLPDALSSNAERLARLEREARAVAALNHPNIIVLHSIEESSGIRFLTMELVDGATLDTLIAAEPLPIESVVSLAGQVADALAAAHERGVVHRDLKPRNIMVTRGGRVKVLDFGLAKWAGGADEPVAAVDATATAMLSLSTEGLVVGTVPYMAPEQIRGESTDARTDLFALGIILYELATGHRPFPGSTAADISSSILRDDPPPMTRRRPDVPRDLESIARRCLQKDPRERFQSAADVVRALRAMSMAPAPVVSESAGDDIRSLAVLPLDNVSHDPVQEYFADGMTGALISNLARLGNLRVISRTSAMRYKGVQKSLPDIARELNVDAILEGSALLVGNRVRIQVQLVSARRDETVWSERYDRSLEDVLALQDDVAEAVVREIALRVTAGEAARLARRKEVNPQAHIEFLKGQHIAAATSPQAVELSIKHFQRALELDPTFAPAWAGLADCHYTRASRGMAPPAEARIEAERAAMKALELDESLADAYVVLGALSARDLDFDGAIRHLSKAVTLNPGLASAHFTLGRIYYCTERHAEAEQAMLKALSLDPLSMIIHTTVGDAYYYAREYEKSTHYYRKAIELDPRFDGAHTDLARSLEALGRFDEARKEYEEGRKLAGTVAGPSFGLAHLQISMGNVAAGRRMLDELVAARSERVVSAWGIAVLHSCLGDVDEAFRWLDIAVDEGATGLVFLRVHPRLDPIRKDPRFAALVKRYGLDQA